METAVEWLEEFMTNGKRKSIGIISLACAKAKEMEKKQTLDDDAEDKCEYFIEEHITLLLGNNSFDYWFIDDNFQPKSNKDFLVECIKKEFYGL
jgi:transposase